ncbi:MAG: hypothetical protein ACXWVE_10235 [Rhodoplanes sp.]
MRTTAAALFVSFATSIAFAQREPRPPFPAEKFSPYPVQPKQSSKPASMPDASENEHKQRWEERSRKPSGEPK